MKALLLTGLSGLALFFGTPLLNEYQTDPCVAYNTMAVRAGAPLITIPGQAPNPLDGRNVGQILQGGAKGQAPRAKTAAPPDPLIGLTCTTRYWRELTGIGKA